MMQKQIPSKSYTVYQSAILFALIGFFAGIIETIIKVIININTEGEGMILALYGFGLGYIIGIVKIIANKSKYLDAKKPTLKAKDIIFETSFHLTVFGFVTGITIGFAADSNLAPLVGIEGAIVGFVFGLIIGVMRYFSHTESQERN